MPDRAAESIRAAPERRMPTVSAFHSINEATKPPATRVFHNNIACRTAQKIPEPDRRNGTCGYRLCYECATLNVLGR